MRLITVQAIVPCFLLISAVYRCAILTVIINLPDNIPAFFLDKERESKYLETKAAPTKVLAKQSEKKRNHVFL